MGRRGCILSIECSGKAGSVALTWESPGEAQGYESILKILPAELGSGRSLAPAIADLLHEAGIGSSDLSGIAVANGPGSFTGLRVGVATAKALGFAWNVGLIPINTLEGIFFQAQRLQSVEPSDHPLNVEVVWTVVDAFRNELFVAKWESVEGSWVRTGEPSVMGFQEFQRELDRKNPEKSAIYSPDSDRIQAKFASFGAAWVDAIECRNVVLMADTLGEIGMRTSTSVSSQELKIEYLRRSAAEEKVDKS